MGQLAAIGTAVLQGMSIPYTNDVYHQLGDAGRCRGGASGR